MIIQNKNHRKSLCLLGLTVVFCFLNYKTRELSRDIVIKYIEKVTVYDNEKIDVILKYEDEIIKK